MIQKIVETVGLDYIIRLVLDDDAEFSYDWHTCKSSFGLKQWGKFLSYLFIHY